MKKYIRFLKRISKYLLLLLFLVFIGLFYARSITNSGVKQTTPPPKEIEESEKEDNEDKNNLLDYLSRELDSTRRKQADKENAASACRITVLNVGQGSCTLIESNGEYMLFDGGDRETSSYVVAYLQQKGISHIKYLVASHYHADHVYGLIGVIESGITYDSLICPDYETSVYAKDMLFERVPEEKRIEPYVTQRFEIGDITARCICPVTDAYSDDNGYSIGMVFTYKNMSLLIDGDATEETETDMLENGVDVKADILVVPHHGSMYSSSAAFLIKVSASAAIISCGEGNEYGHPHMLTLQRLKDAGISSLYRTDLQGNIEISYDDENQGYRIEEQNACDENKLWLSGQQTGEDQTQVSGIWNGDGVEESYYIGNTASKKFHRPSCSQLPSDKKQILFGTRQEALQNSYVPCDMCKP